MPKKSKGGSQNTVARRKERRAKAFAVDFGSKGTVLKQPAAPLSVEGAIKHITSLRLRVAKAQASVPVAPKGWLAVPDTKVADVALTAVAELKEFTQYARSVISQSLGLKAIPIVLPLTMTMSALSTGVVNTVLNVAVSDSPEWVSIQALFDEYKFHSGVVQYVVCMPTATVVLGTSSLTTNALCTIGFDPADATPATDVRDVLQLSQHKQLFPRMIQTPTVGTFVGVYGRQDNEPHFFRFEVGSVATAPGNGGITPGTWKSTQLSAFSDGYLKPYYASGGNTTTLPAVVGTLYYTLHLRSRT